MASSQVKHYLIACINLEFPGSYNLKVFDVKVESADLFTTSTLNDLQISNPLSTTTVSASHLCPSKQRAPSTQYIFADLLLTLVNLLLCSRPSHLRKGHNSKHWSNQGNTTWHNYSPAKEWKAASNAALSQMTGKSSERAIYLSSQWSQGFLSEILRFFFSIKFNI